MDKPKCCWQCEHLILCNPEEDKCKLDGHIFKDGLILSTMRDKECPLDKSERREQRMTTEEAISILKRKSTIPDDDYCWDEIEEAFNMAIEALKKVNRIEEILKYKYYLEENKLRMIYEELNV